jgi:hypothetical protein
MTTGFRLSPEMRALLRRIGGGNIAAGLRALVVIGAYHVGQPIQGLDREAAHALTQALDDATRIELKRILSAPQRYTAPQAAPEQHDDDDDFPIDVGMRY